MGEIWGDAGRELCFIADLRTSTGGGRSFTKETGSVLEPNIVVCSKVIWSFVVVVDQTYGGYHS
jgi:hypothetical protein